MTKQHITLTIEMPTYSMVSALASAQKIAAELAESLPRDFKLKALAIKPSAR